MNFRQFMLQNAGTIENVKCVISNRFLDDEGKPMEWELRCLNRDEEEEVMKTCFKSGNGQGVTNYRGVSLDELLYTGKILAKAVVYPNLNDKELQDSYGVMSSDQLLKKMLTSGEFFKLQMKIQQLSASKPALRDKVEQVKK